MRTAKVVPYRFLTKRQKEQITFVTANDLDAALDREMYATYYWVVQTLAVMAFERIVLSPEQSEALIHPYTKWGINAHNKMLELSRLPDKKQTTEWLSRSQKVALAEVDAAVFKQMWLEKDTTTAKEVYKALMNLQQTHTLTDGQLDFIELYQNLL